MIDVSNITALIKTFERPDVCRKAIAALRKYYPDISIIVGDDSRNGGDVPDFGDVKHMLLPYDVGLSAGRNALVDACQTRYALVMDDDMIINEAVDLGAMLGILTGTDAVVVSCHKVVHGRYRNTGSVLRLDGSTLHVEPPSAPWTSGGAVYAPCEYLPNFILSRTTTLQDIRWDERFMCGGEHLDFFLRLKAEWPMSCAFCLDMYFDDDGAAGGDYAPIRKKRGRQDATAFRKKWGIKKIVRWQDSVSGKWDYEKQTAA